MPSHSSPIERQDGRTITRSAASDLQATLQRTEASLIASALWAPDAWSLLCELGATNRTWMAAGARHVWAALELHYTSSTAPPTIPAIETRLGEHARALVDYTTVSGAVFDRPDVESLWRAYSDARDLQRARELELRASAKLREGHAEALQDAREFLTEAIELRESGSAAGSKKRARIELIQTEQIFEVLPPLKWLSDSLMLGPGRPTMVVAKGGTGKTMILQSLALSATLQTNIWKKFETSEQMRVVHLDYEQGKHATRMRYQRLLAGMSWRIEDVGNRLELACLPRLRLTDSDAEHELSRLCEGRQLLIIDSLRACAGGDENDSRMREHVDTLTRVSEATGVAVVFVHHAGKGNPDDSRDLGRGSSALFDACGAVYAVRRSKIPNNIEVEMTKIPASAEGQKIEDFGLEFVDIATHAGADVRPISINYRPLDPKRNDTASSDPDAEFASTRTALLEILKREPGQGINALAPRVGKKKAHVQDILEALLESGHLDVRAGSKNSKLYSLTELGACDADR